MTPRDLNANYPRWTRDGKALYFGENSGRPVRVFRVAVDGGAPELVAEDASSAGLDPQAVHAAAVLDRQKGPAGGPTQ